MYGFSCDNCGSFCTYVSVGMHASQFSELNKQYCMQCRDSFGLVPILAHSCRLQYCSSPREFGEFCSRNHAFYFYRDNLHLDPELAKHLPDAVDVTLGDYESLVMYLEYHRNMNKQWLEIQDKLEADYHTQEETGQCQYTSTSAPFSRCLKNVSECRFHANWYDIAMKRLALKFQIEPYDQPDPQWIKQKRTEPASVSLFEESVNDSSKVSICRLAYVWEKNDKDYMLFNNPEPFLLRHYHNTKLFKKNARKLNTTAQ